MVPPVSSPSLPSPPSDRRAKAYGILCGVVAVILAGLLIYSQIRAFSWDSGFHLLAARLIREGKRPYLDFCFPQTPLNAYLNAAWMSIFGDTWRSVQALAAILTAGAILLTADFVYLRFPEAQWKLPGAIFAAVLCASIYNVVAYGAVAQAYGISLFLSVAGLRLAMDAVRRGSLWLIFAAAVSLSASAACSLLTAAAVPVILVWCVFENPSRRWKTAAAFVAGSIVPFLPVARLAVEGPRQVLFNLVQYQTLYRRVKWDGASEHDIEILFSLTGTPAALLLILLAAAGLWWLTRNSDVDRRLRSELYLSAAVGIAISAEVATAHPTFERYFLLATPFLAIPAAVGLFVAGSRLYRADRPWPVVGAAAALAIFGLTGQLYDERDSLNWRALEQVAAKVNQVTPPGAPVFLDEPTFYLSRRPLPDGMEFSHAYKLELSAAQNRLLHIIPQARIDEMIRQKTFATVETCDDDEVDRLKLDSLYSEHATLETCNVYWKLR
jgi:hypothetical protein